MPPRRRRRRTPKKATGPAIDPRVVSGSISEDEAIVLRAQEAVRRFRVMIPSLTTYARSVTKDNNVRVQLHAGPPMTDGKIIYMRPPASLGDGTPHDRAICGKRDEYGILVCAACRSREFVDITIRHEVAHIAFDSFEEMGDHEKREIVVRALDEAGTTDGTSRAEKIKARINSLRPAGCMEAAQVISPFLPGILNGLEDARVNIAMYNARPGTYKMFKAQATEIFQEGMEDFDGSMTAWADLPHDAQVVVGLYAKASGLDYKDWFSAEVIEALDDPEMSRHMATVQKAKSVRTIYKVCFPVLEVLRKYGLCVAPDDPEDDAPEGSGDSDTGEAGEADDAGESDDVGSADTESDDSLDTDDTDESAAGSAEPSESDEAGDSSSEGPKTSDTDESDVDADDDDAESTGEPDEGDDGSEENDESDDLESDDESGDSGASDDESESDPKSSDDESDDESDGAPGDGDGADGDGDEEDDDFGDDGSGDSEEDDDDPFDDEDDDDDDDEDFDDDDDDESSSGDDTGSRVSAAERALEAFGGHQKFGSKRPTGSAGAMGDSDDGPMETPEEVNEEQAEVDRAIVQGEHFDAPTRTVYGVNVWKDCDPTSPGWNYIGSDWQDQLTLNDPPETLMGPALQSMRVVFSDNKKARYTRNLKSGRISTRTLGKRAPIGDPRIFQKKREPAKKDYFVVIGIDISGSTHGSRIQMLKDSAYAQAELLHRAGIGFAVYAHTGTPHGSGGYSGDYTCDLDIHVIKDPQDKWDTRAKERLRQIYSASANLDGHTLEFYRKVAERQRATDKIVLYYTDGQMPCENFDDELDVLQREIRDAPRRGITIVGIGVMTDAPEQHGLDTIRIDTIEEVPKVVRDLESRLEQEVV